MFPASIFIEHLSQDDMALLLHDAEERHYLADEGIVLEGDNPRVLSLLTSGLVSVYVDGLGGERRELARLGPGEFIGDVAWLENSPASASVRALENSVVLSMSTQALDDLLASRPPLATRFLRAMARLNAGRVRRLTKQLRNARADADSLAQTRASALLERLAAFKGLLLRVEREATSRDGASVTTISGVTTAFDSMVNEFSAAMVRLECEGRAAHMEELAVVLQRELLPYLLLTGTAARFFTKPRGYAGDCETISLVYANVPSGAGSIGPLLDSCFLERPGPKAVRNRRRLVAKEILATVERTAGQAYVASLACGPATEAYDAYQNLSERSKLRFTAIDIDRKALEMVGGWANEMGLSDHVRCHQANLVYLSTGRQVLDFPPQALVYSIGLIDYFNDEFVIKLLDWIHDRLMRGGRVLLGNFHPRHPDRHFMDQILEWRLIHRSEEDLNRLFAASKFDRPCSRILVEDEGVNLFAEGVRP